MVKEAIKLQGSPIHTKGDAVYSHNACLFFGCFSQHAESDEGQQLHSVYGALQELLLLILMLTPMM